MKYKQQQQQSGFTLVETLIAVLILSISIGALLSLAAGGFYSVRYSRNQIVANNLLQESLEYVRNTRDTAFLNNVSWQDWQSTLKTNTSGVQTGLDSDGCFSQEGCFVDPYALSGNIKKCSPSSCPNVLYYPDNSFYGYSNSYPFSTGTTPYQTSFIRKITVKPSSTIDDQVVVTGTISWLNGTTTRSVSQSILITNWRP